MYIGTKESFFFYFFLHKKLNSCSIGSGHQDGEYIVKLKMVYNQVAFHVVLLLLLLLFQVFNIRSVKPAVPEIPTTPPPTPFYKTTEGIITMASACVVVLLAVVTVLLWRKHAKKRYDMKTP